MKSGGDASNRGTGHTDRDSEPECSRWPVGLSQHDLVKVKAVNAE